MMIKALFGELLLDYTLKINKNTNSQIYANNFDVK